MDGGCAVEGMEGGRAPTLCTSRWWCGVGGHSSPSGYQMSKTGCSINGNQAMSLSISSSSSTMEMELAEMELAMESDGVVVVHTWMHT